MRFKVYAKWHDEVATVYECDSKEEADYIANIERAKQLLLSFFVVHHEWYVTMTYDRMKKELNDEIMESNSTLQE